MTYGPKQVVGITAAQPRKGYFGQKEVPFGKNWGDVSLGFRGWTLQDLYTYGIGAHQGHILEFCVALTCYYLFFNDGTWMEECKTFKMEWVAKVVAFNLLCEITFVGGWHWLTYMSKYAQGIQPFKFNKVNQYEKAGNGKPVGMFSSSSKHLDREVFYNTLGWLQSAGLQCTMMFLWASGKVPVYTNFWGDSNFSVLYGLGFLKFVTYFRELHFYWCHRGMHPWWNRNNGLAQGDIGAFLYRHVHSLHHKSYNPGPWSGLSMHPVEHLMYYSCTWIPLFFLTAHPIHFLYNKFHADIAPIGGHDGFDEPSANGDFHYLHHAKFECNYGVPFPIDFDRMFGTWEEWKDFKKTGKLSAAAEMAKRRGETPQKAK